MTIEQGSRFILYGLSLLVGGYGANAFLEPSQTALAGVCCSDGSPCSSGEVCCTVKGALDCSADKKMYCAAPSECTS